MPNLTSYPHALIVFDMDGVLIDVSRSYRETTRQAARLFFTGAIGWQHLPNPLFSLADLADIKQAGGLNNDWDVTYRVIQLLCQRVAAPQTTPDMDISWESYRNTLSTWDVNPLTRFLDSTRHPLASLFAKSAAMDPADTFVAATYRGDVGSGNIIKQIFQEIYLGPMLFSNTYGFSPALHTGNGLNAQEKPLIEPSLVRELANKNILAVATGRPGSEAKYGLDMFGFKKYFTRVLTLDDCLAAEHARLKNDETKRSLSKPDPFMLDAIGEQIAELPAKRYYVGDMPDDMLAASRSEAGFIGIGFTASAQDKTGLDQKLMANGASRVFDTADDLVQFFSAR